MEVLHRGPGTEARTDGGRLGTPARRLGGCIKGGVSMDADSPVQELEMSMREALPQICPKTATASQKAAARYRTRASDLLLHWGE
jgi:hypothetical protein